MHKVHKEAVELGLVKLAGTAKASMQLLSHLATMESFAAIALGCPGALAEDDTADMLTLSKMLKRSSSVNEIELEQQAEALASLRAMASDDSYDGILASFLGCQNCSMIFGAVLKSVEEGQKQFGASFLLRDLAGRSSDVDSPRN